eukprot:scaffold2673_cov278-Chaetoceros_neogracile.AAC.9
MIHDDLYLSHSKEAEDVSDDWKKDAGEKAIRIWEWWKDIVVGDKEFPCFSTALRLLWELCKYQVAQWNEESSRSSNL